MDTRTSMYESVVYAGKYLRIEISVELIGSKYVSLYLAAGGKVMDFEEYLMRKLKFRGIELPQFKSIYSDIDNEIEKQVFRKEYLMRNLAIHQMQDSENELKLPPLF
ncbi:hypothetical protein CH352_01635 [Leptospira hartskeerlii]|uniref:Uncharacterized protein n=2 Tax=Leptospira hartskeerlii TaxID=2023177 RepID=A0A2M9XDR0_9LEPT|nr:hypothetical protein CH357_09340 [Leptospira hartskeerlii]PJZ35350.1 hypothetical protein CH352_01635 [Leptospira hartskeerlii]